MAVVWVADHGVQGDLSVVSMHDTPEAAAKTVRQRFQAPFAMDWEPLELSPDGDQAVLVGAAPPGPGFLSGHLAVVLLQRWDVRGD